MKDTYPTGKADLMTAFMVRAQGLTIYGGTWAMINLPSWMSLKSFEELRHDLLEDQRIVSMVHLGRGVFGSDFGSVAFVIDNVAAKSARGVYRRLFEQHVEVRSVSTIEALFRDPGYNRYEVSQAALSVIPGSPIVYWLSEKMRAIFRNGTPLGAVARAKAGISTGDNAQFQRLWFEVSWANTAPLDVPSLDRPFKWYPCRSGGEFRRWYGNAEVLIDWGNNGESIRAWQGSAVRNLDYQGLQALTYSKISSGDFALRSSEAGFLFDDTGRSLLSDSSDTQGSLLSLLNSNVGKALLSALAPTMTFTSGEIEKVPVFTSTDDRIPKRVDTLIRGSERDWNSAEVSWGFERNSLVSIASD